MTQKRATTRITTTTAAAAATKKRREEKNRAESVRLKWSLAEEIFYKINIILAERTN